MKIFDAAQTISPKGRFVLFLGLLLVLSVALRSALFEMWESWQTDEYSYGYLIPLISAWFLANELPSIPAPSRPSWAAAGALFFCLLFQTIFAFAGIKGLLPQLYLLSVSSLVILFLGNKALHSVIGPLFLLFFAAPLPKFFYYTVSFNMQLLSTSLGTHFLMLAHIPVYQDGNIIDLGNYKLDVVEACNGVRYLFPLMSLGAILAYLYKAPLWKRGLLFLSTAPIAILMNGIRIAFIGITVSHWGPRWVEGFTHTFEGWLVFLGCFFLLLAEIWMFQTCGKRYPLDLEAMRLPSLRPPPHLALGSATIGAGLFLALGLGISLATPTLVAEHLNPVPLHQPLAQFPLKVGNWTGQADTLDARALSVLGTDQYFLADYRNGDAPPVNLYMLYYPIQDSTTNQALHSPLFCVPGGGWTIDTQTSRTIALSKDRALRVNELLISKGSEREIVLFWFVQNGEATIDTNFSKFVQIKNALLKGRTDGAMIRLVTQLGQNETQRAAEARIDRFANESLDPVYTYLGWSLSMRSHI